jgi:hypothetical protein
MLFKVAWHAGVVVAITLVGPGSGGGADGARLPVNQFILIRGILV